MSETKKEIETYISDLPPQFSADDIQGMHDALVKDMEKMKKTGMSESTLGLQCQQNHRQFAFSYPGLFFKVLKGEMKPGMLNSMLNLKKKLDTKELSIEEARMGVIDGAKEDIKKNPKESRPKKAKGDVQEMTVNIKSDGSIKD